MCWRTGGMKPLTAMDRQVELGKVMGSWYVLAHIPVFIEKNAYNAVESYKWDAKHKRFDVTYTFNEGKGDGPVNTSYQRGYIKNSQTFTDLLVSPKLPLFGYTPLRLPYIITDCAEDYSNIIVGYPSRSYLWIMARTPTVTDDVYEKLIDKAKSQGYDPKLIRMVPQDATQHAFPVPTEPAP